MSPVCGIFFYFVDFFLIFVWFYWVVGVDIFQVIKVIADLRNGIEIAVQKNINDFRPRKELKR